jgi:cold shock CspA family protein
MCNGEDERQIGRIKWFNNKKGFGFLSNCLTNEDVFIHHTGIKLSEESLNSDVNIFKTVIEGEYVSYEKQTDSAGRSVAKNVSGIMGGPLLCENVNKKIFISNRHTEKNSSEGSSVRRNRDSRSHTHSHSHSEAPECTGSENEPHSHAPGTTFPHSHSRKTTTPMGVSDKVDENVSENPFNELVQE